jgi:GT2 family glycosyltransferase
MDQSKFTVIIPSKEVDHNLLNCEKKIRQFYKKIKVLLMVDEVNDNFNLSDYTSIVSTGLVNVAEKRNIGFKQCTTEFIVFIDSDAYPTHPWLDKIENVFKQNPNVGACGGSNLSPEENDEEKKLISSIKKSIVVSQNAKLVKHKQSQSRLVNFLPTCNLVIKRSILQNTEPMDKKLFAHEDISLNENIRKSGYKIYYEPSSYVYHKDRSIKSFLNQRFIYGTESINIFTKFPCKSSFNLFISTIPFIFLLLLITNIFVLKILEININLLNVYFFYLTFLVVFSSIIVIIFETFRVFLLHKKNFFKIFILLFMSVFLPGLGQVMKPFLTWKLKRKIWIQ